MNCSLGFKRVYRGYIGIIGVYGRYIGIMEN